MMLKSCRLCLLIVLNTAYSVWCDVMMSSVSANLATALDSTVPVSTSFTKISSNLTMSTFREKESFIVVAPTLVANNIKILTSSAVLRVAISTGGLNSRAFLLKEGFKFFRSASGGTSSKTVYTLQETAGSPTMAVSNTQPFTTGTNAEAAGDIVGTNNILLAIAATAWTMDITTTNTVLTAALPEITSSVLHAEFIPALNSYFIGKLQLETNLLSPTTLAATRRPTLPATRTARAYLTDNISPAQNLFIALDDLVVYKASWAASSVSLSFSGSFLSGASTFGTPTGMANLGSYQIMMVFVTRATAPTYVAVLDKFEMKPLDTSALTIPGLVYVAGTATGMTTFDQSTFFWGQIYSAASVFNFHTYQLRVDPCILRNYLGVCTTCIKPTILIGNTSSNICNFSTAVPDGWGINAITSQATKCKDANCLLCGQDYSVCTSCDTSKGVKLVSGTCQSPVTMGVSFVPTSQYSTAPYHTCGEVVVWLKNDTSITLPPSLSNSFLNTEDDAFRPPNMTLKLKNSLGNIMIFTDYKVRPLAQSQFLMLELSCGSLALDNYKLMVEPGEVSKSYTIDTVPYNVVFDKAEFDLGQVGSLQESDPSGLVWAGTYGLSSIDQPTSTSIGFVALTLDPTGTFFRFTKILQIVNKLYFININYGKRLEAFLAKCKIALQNYYNDNELVYHSANFRGRLDQGKSGVSLLSVSRTMIVFYLLSWALQVIKRFMLDHCTLGRVGIYFCHYANKVHLIVFNLVFVDFLWLAPRTLLHSRDLSRLETNGAILVLCLVGLDLYMILAHLLDKRVWQKALEHYKPKQEYKPLGSEQQEKPRQHPNSHTAAGQMENNSMLLNNTREVDETFNGLTAAPAEELINNPEIDFEKEGYWKVTMKQINYKKTYFEIDFNVHLMDMATWHLRMTPLEENQTKRPSEGKSDPLAAHWSQQSMLCKVLVVYPWFRASLLQITIQNTQYAVFTGIWVLFTLELARLFATIYAYLKYKYLKNIICLLMEVLPSGLLSLIFVIALLISPKRFDEPVIDFYQDAGIWIVIASCVAEYLLLITYITVAAYEFIKNRNMMKKMKVKPRVYSLFQFDDLRPWLLGRAQPFEHPHPLDPESPEQAAPMSVVADANLSRQGEVDSIDMRIKPIQRRMQQVQVNAVMPVSNTSAQKARANLNNELSKLSEMNRGGMMPRSMMGKSKGQAEGRMASLEPVRNQSPPSRRNGGSPSPDSARRKRSPPPNVVQQERQMRGNQFQQQQTEVSQNPDLSRLQTNQNDTTQDPLRAQVTTASLNQSSQAQPIQNRGRINTLATQQSGVSGAANLVDDSLNTRTGDSRMQMHHQQMNVISSQQQQQVRANPQPVVNGGNYGPQRDSSPDPRAIVNQSIPMPQQQRIDPSSPQPTRPAEQTQRYPNEARDRSPEVVGGSSPNLQNSRGYLVPIKPSNIPTLTNFTPGQGIMDYATMLRFPNQVMIPGFGLDNRGLDAKSGQYELGSGVPLGKDESSSHGGVKELPQEHPLGLEGKPILPSEFTAPPNRLPTNDQQLNIRAQPNHAALNPAVPPVPDRQQQRQDPRGVVQQNAPSNPNPGGQSQGVRMPPPRQRSPQPTLIPNGPNGPVQQPPNQNYRQAQGAYPPGQQMPPQRSPAYLQGTSNPQVSGQNPGYGQAQNQGQNNGRPQPQNPHNYATVPGSNAYHTGPQPVQRPKYGSPPPQRVSSPKPDTGPMHSSNSPRQRPQPANPQLYRQQPHQQGQYQPPQQQFRPGPTQQGQQNPNFSNQKPMNQTSGPNIPQGVYNPPQQLAPQGRINPGQPQPYPQGRAPAGGVVTGQGQYPRYTQQPANMMNQQPQGYPERVNEQIPRAAPNQRSPPPAQRVDPRSGAIPAQPQYPARDQGQYVPSNLQQQPRQSSPQPQMNQPGRQTSPPPGQQQLPQGRIPPQNQPQMQPAQRTPQPGYPSQQMPLPHQNPRQAPPNPQYQNPGAQQQQYRGPPPPSMAPPQNQSRSLPPGQRPGPPAPAQPQHPTNPGAGTGFVLPPHPRQRSPVPSAINYTLHPIREAPQRPPGSRSPPPQERQASPPLQGMQVAGPGQSMQSVPQQARMASPPPQLRQASPTPQGRQASPPPLMRQGSPGPQKVPLPQGQVPRNREGSPQPQAGAYQPQQSRSPPPRQ